MLVSRLSGALLCRINASLWLSLIYFHSLSWLCLVSISDALQTKHHGKACDIINCGGHEFSALCCCSWARLTSSWSTICCFRFSASWLCWLISSSCGERGKERGRSELWRLHFLMHFSNSVWEVFITLSSSCWYRSLISSSYWVFSESERRSGGGAEASIMGAASEFFNSLLLCCSSAGTVSPKDKEVKYVSPAQLQQ